MTPSSGPERGSRSYSMAHRPWARENGTICPFGVLSPVLQWFLVTSKLSIFPVMRAIVVLLGFPCFAGISSDFWGLGTQIHHLSFSTSKMALVTLQKHYVLKGNVQFWSKKYYKTRARENAKRTNRSIFTHVPPLFTQRSEHSYFKDPFLHCKHESPRPATGIQNSEPWISLNKTEAFLLAAATSL